MKKFYLCKLCLIVFGALLASQSVFAQGNYTDPFRTGEELKKKLSRPDYLRELDPPSCSVREYQFDLSRPTSGKDAVVLRICDSFRAAEYLVTAISEKNAVKITKAKEVCTEGIEVGLVKKLGETTSISVEEQNEDLYVSC